MLTMTSLKGILAEIFGIDEKYVIPLRHNWLVPQHNQNEQNATIIGYDITPAYPAFTSLYALTTVYQKEFKSQQIRLTFMGANVEELAMSTLLWEDRRDVKELFEKLQVAVVVGDLKIHSEMSVQEGKAVLLWVARLTCHNLSYSKAEHIDLVGPNEEL